LKMRATSLCHSDVGVISGEYGPGIFPIIGGHEAVGIVAALGPGAASFGFKVGDLVGATAWHGACLECSGCSYGRQYCDTLKVKGINAPGYFAEYSVLDASLAIPVTPPEGVSPERLAPIFCAGITVWDALERANIRPGETIAIIGAGGLGQLAVKYAAALGATVIALDVRDEQLEACKAPKGLGASHTINTSSLTGLELSKRVREVNGGKLLNCLIVTTGALPAYTASFPLIAPEGRLIAVGIPSGPIPVSSAYLSRNNIR
jgi:propanol-preferring alcohol dehydrogenase